MGNPTPYDYIQCVSYFKLRIDNCIKICKSCELAEIQMQEFIKEKLSVKNIIKRTHQEQSIKPTKILHKEVSEQHHSQCTSCGYAYGFTCPAFKQQCNMCQKFGHYAKKYS